MNYLKLALGSVLGTVAGLVGVVSAHAQTVPTLSTSDIAAANGPVWTALVDIIKYYVATYGVLMLWIGGIIAVFALAFYMAKKLFFR